MLSKRLLTIANLVSKDSIVYDIGSDHALLPIYLVKNKICIKAYAGDNKIGPINSAKNNISKYQLDDSVIPVLADGFDDIPMDVDTIVIAGMGYHNVVNMLEGVDITRFKYIIVQVNKEMDEFRKYLSSHNCSILNEEIIFEDLFYEIIVFNTDYHESYSDEDIVFGPILKNSKSSIYDEYLLNQKNILENILKSCDLSKHQKRLEDINTMIKKRAEK